MDLLRRIFRLRSPLPRRVSRERFLLPHEWTAIRPVLDAKPLKVRVYFTFLFLTGARRDEARTATWTEIDLEQGIWHKAKGKTKRRHALPLPPEACALLGSLPRHSPFVFPGETPAVAWSRTAVKYWWRKIRFEAGCPDVRIHDLRRSCASWLTMNGENLKVVQSVLDHRSLTTTQIYARLDLTAIREALNRHARRVFQNITASREVGP